jgi:NADH-quinone oxidoreductase subunit G
VVEGATKVNRHSVISANKYRGSTKPDETIVKVMDGRSPKLLMNIHTVSEVNRPEIELGEIMGPAIGEVFENNQADISRNRSDQSAIGNGQ